MRRRLLVAGVLVAILAAAFGLNALLHSRLLRVTEVRVEGAHLLTRSEVTTMAAVPAGASLPLLNTRHIEQNLSREVWIRSATVSRKLAHKVIITIKERSPALAVETGKGASWLVSADKVWLGSYDLRSGAVQRTGKRAPLVLPAELRAQVIPLTDVEGLRPQAGKAANNSAVNNAVAISSGLSAELRAQIKSISAPDVVSTTLYLRSGVEVDIGSAEQIADKDTIIRQILKEQAGKVTLINVTTVDKPTWRGLETKP